MSTNLSSPLALATLAENDPGAFTTGQTSAAMIEDLPPPAASDVSAFENRLALLSQTQTPMQTQAQTQAQSGFEPDQASGAWRSLLGRVEEFSDSASREWKNALSIIEQPDVVNEPQSLLKVQAALVEHSFLYEVIGKGIGKAVQNIDQLVHTQ